MFSNLHQHTDASLHDGYAKIPDLVSRAKELGYPALAITDHGTVTGLIAFYEECKKQGVKPILGCEFYYTNEITVKEAPTYHLLILAKDNEGYKNMMKLDTYAHEHFYRKPRIGIEALKQYHEGLICTTACIAGPLSSPEPESLYNNLLEIFGDDLYLEIQPHDFQEQIEYNEKWKDYFPGSKTIVTLDSHYIGKEDIQAHKLWLGLGDDSQYYASDDYYLRSEDEVLDWFKEHGIDARPYIDNVQEIVDKCNVEIEFGGQHYPVFCDDPATYVKQKCNEGFKALGIGKYPDKDKYIKQVRHEFKILSDLKYLNYFCIIDDMIRHCREVGIPTGLGRGSVVGSLTAYLMGITKLDPIKYNLVFERFANPERVTPADIDTDVSTPRRSDVIEYVKEKYGEVYQVRTISYIQDKSAVQRSAQALGIAPAKYIKMSKDINTVEDMPAKTKEQKEWKDLAMKFRGHIISYGCHASAVLVSPEDVCNWTAIEKQGDNMVVCHDFHQLEAQGLLKLDILGLETLDIIEQTKHRAGIDIDVAKIPVDDKTTAAMLRKGDTTGCFQIESNVMTNIIIRMNVKNVEDMSAVVALGRPGPLDSGMAETFLRRRNHQEPTVYDIPELEPILRDTEGVILYQEQIMQIARKICGYSLGEADNLRRIIGRKVVDEMKPAVDDMIARGVKNGYSEAQMKRLTDNIITFAAYGFNHCLSGDTVIMRDANGCKPLTIREMYLMKERGKALSISGDRIKKNDIVNIFYSGKNKVYKVETESGEFVKCTALHKIPTPDGMVYMKDLKVGDTVYRKGTGYELLTTVISSITYVGIEDVYDIEMAAPNHTVVVNNGLVVSNSHSAAYGMTAWVTAYLKAHYPAAFMASLLDSNCKDKPKLASYILEAMHMGIKILPPQLSHHNCYSDYDEEGAYIILGLNCIAGVGNTQIPKDSPKDFKEFLEVNINMNKTVLSNLVKAGVFKGNRDEMLQYIVWAKDKRKSKGEFKYTPTTYNEQMEESKVMGMSFGDIFSKYKMDLVNNVDIFGYEVLNVKGRKTKTGKNMAFVKVRDNKAVHDLVIFNDRYKDIKPHNVYIMKVRNNRIFDFTEAKLA